MYRTLFFFLFTLNIYGQETLPKYALLIQNIAFKNKEAWSALDDQKGNLARMKELLIEQGFKEENIHSYPNLDTEKTRQAYNSFIKRLSKKSVVVVYLSSKGERVEDKNGDEEKNDSDKFDEVFICTDSPSLPDINKETKTNKKGFDSHPNALIDDEIGAFNDSIINAIGPEGHFLFLADFCKSAGTKQGSTGAAKGTEEQDNGYPQIKNFENLDKSNSNAKTTFIGIFGTNTFLKVPPKLPNNIGFFVNAFDYALHDFSKTPTYGNFFESFKQRLIGDDKQKNGGQPDLFRITDRDKQKLLFNGAWKFNFISYGLAKLSEFTISKGDGVNTSNLYSFHVSNISPYIIGDYVDIYDNQIFRSKGIVKSIDSILVLSISSTFTPNKDIDYEIRQSESHFKAKEVFRQINKKSELNSVLKILSDSCYKVGVEACVNQYKTPKKGDKTKPTFNKNCIKLIQNMDLDTLDNITLNISNPQKLYYTIVDVTKTYGLKHCFVDTTKLKPTILGFSNQHEKFYSRVTPPYGKSSLWLLITDKIIEDTSFESYLLGTDINENNKNLLWNNIIKHIKYFEEIDYNVLQR